MTRVRTHRGPVRMVKKSRKALGHVRYGRQPIAAIKPETLKGLAIEASFIRNRAVLAELAKY